VKRVGSLWSEVCSLTNLFEAARKAALGKRSRPDVARFLVALEDEVPRLYRELESGEYRPGPYRCFQVSDPKPRQISAAPFRDRVVHHALTQVLEPVFERRFSAHSFACRKGFGSHAALATASEGFRRHSYVVKCDVEKYFASIDHGILKARIARTVKCGRTLGLAALIIDHSSPQEEVIRYFPGDDLFTPYERRRGLPLGNQTSQFFANVYLDPLDQFIERRLKPPTFVRYVDDFLIFADSKAEAAGWLREVRVLLESLRLRLHDGKSRVYRTADGVTFLGWRIFPDSKRLVRENVVRFRRRLRDWQRAYGEGRMDWEDVHRRVLAWIAHASHGNTMQLRQRIFSDAVFRRWNAV
jgi:RNA-directed DNA polymerase